MLLIGFLSIQSAFCQTVSFTLPSISLVKVVSSTAVNFNLNFSNPSDAGTTLSPPLANSNTWLNFTSAQASGITRSVTVHSNTAVPVYLRLNLQVNGPFGSGGGTRGTALSTVEVSTTPAAIVSSIGGSYTGVGVGNGYQLTYSASLKQFDTVKGQSSNLVIVFTLIDN
jgi:hypothetical protein